MSQLQALAVGHLSPQNNTQEHVCRVLDSVAEYHSANVTIASQSMGFNCVELTENECFQRRWAHKKSSGDAFIAFSVRRT